MSRGTLTLLLEVPFSPSPSTEPWLLSKRWSPIRARGGEGKTQKGMHTVKEADMLAAKMDLLIKRLEERGMKKKLRKALYRP